MKKILLTSLLTLALLLIVTSPVLADPEIIWAESPEVIDSDMTDAIATLLLADPPDDVTGYVYAVLDVSNDGGDYIVSIANLDIESPYTGWEFMTDATWADSVLCTGTDPTWDCDYYVPTLGGETGAGSLLFPWKPGTRAFYGYGGGNAVHGQGSGFLPGSLAVDFIGGETYGASTMPAYAYAAASGNISMVCKDDNNAAIVVDSGALGKLLYIHLNPNDINLTIGNTVYAGRPISSLVYGSFGYGMQPDCYQPDPAKANYNPDGTLDCKCGYAEQNASTYHLHFAFIPSSGYFTIGGCNLNVTTANWVCGTQSIGPGGWLSAGGYSPGPDDEPADPDNPGPSPSSLGGESVWDGILGAVMAFAEDMASNLSVHAQIGLENAVVTSTAYVFDLFNFLSGLQLFYFAPLLIIIGIYLSIETIRWVLVAIRWILQFIPTMG